MRTPAEFTLLKDHCVAQRQALCSLMPACLRTEFSVPRGMSLLSFPAIVTSPGFVGCLYWR
jgi:hypothetical protein